MIRTSSTTRFQKKRREKKERVRGFATGMAAKFLLCVRNNEPEAFVKEPDGYRA